VNGVRERLFRTRLDGSAAWVATAVRVTAGGMLVAVSLSTFTRHATLVESFERYGVPVPEVSVYLAGAVEAVAGVLLVIGFLTRPAAVVVAVLLVIATATGGRVDRDLFHLGQGPLRVAACALLAYAGSGRLSVDERLTPPVTARPA
jgi:putative oxidoreductase